MLSLDGKIALVTGGSRGIGREIALILGRLGAVVAVNYVSNSKAATEVCSNIEDEGGRALAVQADLRKVSEIEKLFGEIKTCFGGLDILINNAGIAIFKKVEDFSENEFDEIFDINVKGVFFCCQQAARMMNDGGRIINISSTVTKVMMPNYGAYSATKGAVNQITRVLAKELGSRNIAVNAVSPGPVDTELFREGKTAEQIQAMADMAAFGRIGTPQDIAQAVTMLLGEEAGWVTGQNLYVNGGLAG